MHRFAHLGRAFATLTLTVCLAACGGNGGASTPSTASTTPLQRASGWTNLRLGATGKIQHVVIIVQENRSFDNLFAGFPGANTQSYGYTSSGEKVDLKPVGLEAPWDIAHGSATYFDACDGQGTLPGTDCKMDGFDKEGVNCGAPLPPCPYPHPQYGYVPKSETKPYFAMAKQYVLGDAMFTSNFDASSFVSHQYIIAGQASASVDFPLGGPWGCGGPSDKIATITQQRKIPGGYIVVCFNNQTLGDELSAAGISWKYYASTLNGDGGIWSAYQAIKHIRRSPSWHEHVLSPQTRFFKDIQNAALPAVSWVTPTCANSDHAGCESNHGPHWVASLVNAIGTSQYWNSTAIFVFWDDYGGWYDHVPPPFADYDGLGIRVPLLVISPYAKQGYVSHVQYEHGSILKFVEDQFGLGRLSASDARANSPEADCFDFSKPPRSFTPIPSLLHQADFEREPLDRRAPDNE
jgi:phospholipase C